MDPLSKRPRLCHFFVLCLGTGLHKNQLLLGIIRNDIVVQDDMDKEFDIYLHGKYNVDEIFSGKI